MKVIDINTWKIYINPQKISTTNIQSKSLRNVYN